MFTQQCFVNKNSRYIRDKLLEFGYTEYSFKNNSRSKFIFTEIYKNRFSGNGITEYNFGGFNKDKYNEFSKGYIDCGTNEELFLAIAALRDDSDKHQFFVLETTVNQWSENCKPVGYFVKCVRDKWFFDFDKSGNPSVLSERNISAHKATVPELIEHFNK